MDLTAMPRAGRNLELLVAHLERTLLGTDGVTVESPGFLPDKVTGQAREFDVLVTIKKGHHCVHIAFEVKDEASKIDAPFIEQFATKTSDTDVQDKYFVASSGYFKPALVKAEHHGIKCLTLKEAVELPWFVASNFRCATWRNKSPNYRLILIDETSAIDEAKQMGLLTPAKSVEPQDMDIIDADGNEIEWNRFGALAWQAICDGQSIEDVIDVKQSAQRVQNVELAVEPGYPVYLVWKGSTRRHLIRSVNVSVPYEIDVQAIPFAFHIYQSTTGEPIAEIVQSSEFDALGSKRMISFIKNGDNGETRVILHTQGQSE